jgi:hypothetical protein
VNEESAASAPADFIGQGEFPADLDSVNWPAYLFSYIWVWVYGVKPWVIGITALIVVPIVIENAVLLFVSSHLWSPMNAIVTPILSTLLAVVSFYLGLNGNRILWEQERRKFAQTGSPRDPIPATKYRKSKTRWSRVGFTLAGAALLFEVGAVVRRPASLASVLPAVAVTWLPVIVLLVVSRLRVNRSRSQS